MPRPQARANSLPAWLDYIGSVHFTEIELGLDRVRNVARLLDCEKPAGTSIVVAGTNGKGSTVACLEAALTASGLATGSYTSPHIHRFNERIRINQQQLSDEQIVNALYAVDQARGETSLSYFEFATLAALLLFKEADLDVAILEVGLGGRLDAVNLVDGNITVITSIDLDHQEWLGDDRESIAVEKAGILRQGIPLVCGDPKPPSSLQNRARELNCPSYWFNRDFSMELQQEGYCWRGKDSSGTTVSMPHLEQLSLAPANVACAFQVLQLMNLPLSATTLVNAVSSLKVPGRQEWCFDLESGIRVLLDVAHNPAAMAWLAKSLQQWRNKQASGARIIAVIAVMADKDIQDMARNLESSTDIWYIAELAVPRGLGLVKLEEALHGCGFKTALNSFANVETAYREACRNANKGDLVLVTGSFYTVAEIRAFTTPLAGPHPVVAA